MLHHCQRTAGYNTSFAVFFREAYSQIMSLHLLDFERLLHQYESVLSLQNSLLALQNIFDYTRLLQGEFRII